MELKVLLLVSVWLVYFRTTFNLSCSFKDGSYLLVVLSAALNY